MKSKLVDIVSKREQNDKELNREHAKKAQMRLKRTCARASLDLHGAKVYISAKATTSEASIVAAAIRRHALERVADKDIACASFYFADDPATPGQRITWAARLAGGRVCAMQVLESGGDSRGQH
eukprot:15439070-Alexandrium_andersonii.AAC.1